MPNVIGALDITNVTLVDKIFTLLSFAVKYLTKSIKEDISNFYQVYVELLAHKNKFVRKFAAQAFCYVIRKLTFDDRLIHVLLISLIDNHNSITQARLFDHILGVSELLFEVIYGASEGLHSKAKEVLS
jgi:hypothetical protein